MPEFREHADFFRQPLAQMIDPRHPLATRRWPPRPSGRPSSNG